MMTTPRSMEVESSSAAAPPQRSLAGSEEKPSSGSVPSARDASPPHTANSSARSEYMTRPRQEGEGSSPTPKSSLSVAKAGRPLNTQTASSTRSPPGSTRQGLSAFGGRGTPAPTSAERAVGVGGLRQDSELSRANSSAGSRTMRPGVFSRVHAPPAPHSIEVRGNLVVQNVSSVEEVLALLEDENSPFSLQLQDVELRVGPNQVAGLGAAIPDLREHLRALQREQDESHALGRTRETAGTSRSASLRTNVVLRGVVEGRRNLGSRAPQVAARGPRAPIAGALRPATSLASVPARRLPSGPPPSSSAVLPSATEVRAARARAAVATASGAQRPAEANEALHAQEQSQSLMARLSEVQEEVKSLLANEGVVPAADATKGKGDGKGREGEGDKKGDFGGKGRFQGGDKGIPESGSAKDFSASSNGASRAASSSSKPASSHPGNHGEAQETTSDGDLNPAEKGKSGKGSEERENAEKDEKERDATERMEQEKEVKEKIEKNEAEKEIEETVKPGGVAEGAGKKDNGKQEGQEEPARSGIEATIEGVFRQVPSSENIDEMAQQGEAPQVEGESIQAESKKSENAEDGKKEDTQNDETPKEETPKETSNEEAPKEEVSSSWFW
ncbi:hypothetical protein TGPRC2_220510 [Toxoplasma gondii TgCatPRC2]|uniref:Uncharacterized protein n=1 Tax=Toxoplasma gondii TgCatPRC2 TaxID=1130821 RepID=A0A151H1Q6_TOXGO|nr:hypothetical protein TGPRC2_220510 [Toxoplasma gondii TgCatPRC2]